MGFGVWFEGYSVHQVHVVHKVHAVHVDILDLMDFVDGMDDMDRPPAFTGLPPDGGVYPRKINP